MEEKEETRRLKEGKKESVAQFFKNVLSEQQKEFFEVPKSQDKSF